RDPHMLQSACCGAPRPPRCTTTAATDRLCIFLRRGGLIARSGVVTGSMAVSLLPLGRGLKREGAMRSVGMRSAILGTACMVAMAGMAGCATRSGVGYSEELPSHRMTGMEPSGTVTRVDDTQQVVVLENGQMYRVAGSNAVYVDGRPVAFRSVRPGSRVTIVNGTPVVYQNGQYVLVQSQPATGAVAPGGVLTS